MSNNLRSQMPQTAALIDLMRSTLGPETVNARLREAMAGKPGLFYAKENGLSFGTPDTTIVSLICWSNSGQCYRKDPEWMVEARLLAESKGITIPRCNPKDIDDIHREANALRKIYLQQ